MDVIFKCEHCDQELSVDASGAGSEINCPSCGEALIIPEPPADAPKHTPPHHAGSIGTSAAAKEEKHFSVPVHDKPTEVLIEKPLPPLEVAAKEGVMIRLKTFKRSDCVEVGKDHFDEVVTSFLNKIGAEHIVTISPITYTHQDLASRQWITDFGVMVLYKG